MNVSAWMKRGALVLGLMGSAVAQGQSAVGRTAGEGSVSAIGSARYVIPLTLPPGTNGLTPSLAIAYDSSGGNGLLGAGFHLSGLSVIERCARTLAQDGSLGAVALDATDRYCLDGKRLRVTSGTYGMAGSQYQTEVEEFARVTAYGQAGNGPASFRVETRDGLTYEYGATADSRIESVGALTARVWALSRVRDRSGNYADFVYAEDAGNGSYRPLRIDYSGNTQTGAAAYYAIRFIYEPRPAADILTGYVAGRPVTEPLRLDRIDVQHNGTTTVVRRFDVSYDASGPSGRSRLAAVQECAGDECFPATVFTWGTYASGWGWWDSNTGLSPNSVKTALPGDVDGDGCEDLAYFDSATSRWMVLRGSTIGYVGPAINVGAGTATTATDAISIDVDADGKRDLLVPGFGLPMGANWQWVHHVTGSSYAMTSLAINRISAPGGAIAADIDGDGREDLIYVKTNLASIFWRRNLTASGVPAFAAEAVLWTPPDAASAAYAQPFGTNPQRFRSIVRRGDFNGDGRSDLLYLKGVDCGASADCSVTNSHWYALLSQGTSLATREVLDTAGSPQLGDFNGDGLTDVTYLAFQADGTQRWRIRFGTGAPAPTASPFSAPVVTEASVAGTGAIVVDWDGDGRTDLLLPSDTAQWNFCRSSGATLDACVPAQFAVNSMTGSPLVTDVNGDGLADVVYVATDYLSSAWHYRLHYGDQPDVLASATDGLGNVARFTYATLADRSVYTPGSGSAYPVREFYAPLSVVSRLVQSDGSGGTYTTAMTYEAARMHAQGRGFLGFGRRTSTDSRTGLASVDDDFQDPANFELIGRPSVVTLRQTSGLPVARFTFNWSRYVLGAGTEVRRFPYVASLTADRFELDGARVSSSLTTSTYDGYGSLTDRLTTVTEIAHGSNPGAQHVDRLSLTGVVNDTVNWCLGRPASVVARRSHTLPGGAQIVRTTDHAWDYARCRPTQSVIEPSSATLRLVSDLTYDAYGNLSAQALTPAGQAVRRTAYTWSDAGRFLASVDAPEGYRVTSSWDPVMARRIEARDANGLATQWRYDAFNRVARRIEPDGTSTAATRTWCTGATCDWPGALYKVRTSALGPGDVYVKNDETGFDSLDRAIYDRNEQPRGGVSLTVRRYDARGFLAQESLPSLCCTPPDQWVTHAYDLLGRHVSMERATSASVVSPLVTRWRYDGLNVAQSDVLGRTTTLRHDAIGNVLQVVDPAGADTDYDYDAFGELSKVRDFAGNETTIVRNARGFRTGLTDPDSGTWTFDYSALGEIVSQSNARGQVTRYAYDLLGRTTSRTEAEGVTTWTWGRSQAARNVGALASVASPGIQKTFTYDTLGRVASEAATVSGATLVTSYAYDATTGNLDTLTYPAMTGSTPLRLKHLYDRGELVRLIDADSPAVAFWQLDAVNPAGQVTGATLGNGIQLASRYDAVTGLLQNRVAGPGGSASLQNVGFAWDPAGNLSERADVGRGITEHFQYDNRDRLLRVQRGGLTTLDLAYDDIGNITYKSDIGNYRYDSVRKHAVVAAGSNAYTYDANGAVTGASGSTIAWYSYDLPSQIAHPNGNYSAFYYGPDRGRYRQVARAGASLTDRLYAADGRYERYSQGGVTGERSYIVADGAIVAVRNRVGAGSSTTAYLLPDHLDGVAAFTSSSGALLARASYQALGARRSGDGLGAAPTAAEWQQIQSTTARGYTGHEHLDNLGVVHMNGRVFDPVLGRFLSPDPYIQAPYDAQSLNRYSYVRNNPLRFTDPSGYCFNDHPAADQTALQCFEQMIVHGTGLDSLTADLLAAAGQAASMMDSMAQAGAVGGADLAAAVTAREEIVISAPKLQAEVASVVAIPLGIRGLPGLAGFTGLRTFLLAGMGAAAAGSLFMPAETASDSDLLDENGEPFYVYHFTNELGKRGIGAQGVILPGGSGRIYFSPIPYPTAAAAQRALALPRQPSGYLRVPRENVGALSNWTPVAPNFNQPGGGLEASTTGLVSTDGAQWVPLGP